MHTEVPALELMFCRLLGIVLSDWTHLHFIVSDTASISCGGLAQKWSETVMTCDGDYKTVQGKGGDHIADLRQQQPSCFTLSDTLDGNVSRGGDVICYKWAYWARGEILGRSNTAMSEMICRTSTTDLAGSCANANCPNYSSGEFVDFLAVTSEMAPFLAQWVVCPICRVWQDTKNSRRNKVWKSMKCE